jgi:UDP-N-acetylglucosamine 2-epimerase (non-hydrolysing)
MISVISDLNFAPTKNAKDNLVNEGFSANNIWVTGNTVIDALLQIRKEIEKPFISTKVSTKLKNLLPDDFQQKKYILITMHRREKFGINLRRILKALKELAIRKKEYNFIYSVHMNPNVKVPVSEVLSGIPNFYLIPPQDYLSFIYLMKYCHFIISDSGGIQEECYIFKKPIIVLREVTERKEAIEAGYAFLAGGSPSQLKNIFYDLDKKLSNKHNLFKEKNPFGDGKAAARIASIMENYLSNL